MPRHIPGDWEEDEWHESDYHRTTGGGYNHARPYRRSGDLLAPEPPISSSMRRSRSQGHSPAPNVYVYTSARADAENRSPSPAPRGRTTDILDKLDVIDRDIRHASRSRGPEYRDPSPYYRNMELELARERDERKRMEERLRDRLNDLDRNRGAEKGRDYELLREQERRMRRLEDERLGDIDRRERGQRDEELFQKRLELTRLKERIEREEEDARLEERDKTWKAKLEMEKLKDEQKRRAAELKREEEKLRILAAREKEEAEAKAERKKIIMEMERKEKEEEEERKIIVERYATKEAKKKKEKEEADAAAVAAFEKKREDEKKKKEALKAEFKREEDEKKEKAKREKEEWKLKLELEAKEEKDKKKKREKELEEEMHKKLAVFGFQENQIEAVLKPKKAADLPFGASPHRPRPALDWRSETPTYIKVHRTHIDVETLRYFGLPWEYDASDSNYIIILQEMDTHETELLFEHTRKLHRGGSQLLIEDRGRQGKNEYAFVRRRKPSVSPVRRKRSPSKVRLLSLF